MKIFIFLLIGCSFSTMAFAGTRPFQVSLIPGVAIHSRNTEIKGGSLGVWGENPQSALAVGVVHGSVGNSTGISLGLLGNYSENYQGAHLAVLANYSSAKFTGLQMATFNYAERLHGIQIGIINFAADTDKGMQIGLVNIIKNTQGWFTDLPDEIAPATIVINWNF